MRLLEQMKVLIPPSIAEKIKETKCSLQLMRHFIGSGIITATNKNVLHEMLA